MNNDRFYQNMEDKDYSDFFKSQQFFPGRTGTPPQPPGRGESPFEPPGRGGPSFETPGRGQPSSTPPGRQGQPPSAPPSFTPEMPRGAGQSFTGSPDYGMQFRGDGFNRPRNYWGCLNRVTYIWLFNGNNFWFYPTFIGRRQMEGFRWRQGRWVYDRINLNRILFFTCF